MKNSSMNYERGIMNLHRMAQAMIGTETRVGRALRVRRHGGIERIGSQV